MESVRRPERDKIKRGFSRTRRSIIAALLIRHPFANSEFVERSAGLQRSVSTLRSARKALTYCSDAVCCGTKRVVARNTTASPLKRSAVMPACGSLAKLIITARAGL